MAAKFPVRANPPSERCFTSGRRGRGRGPGWLTESSEGQSDRQRPKAPQSRRACPRGLVRVPRPPTPPGEGMASAALVTPLPKTLSRSEVRETRVPRLDRGQVPCSLGCAHGAWVRWPGVARGPSPALVRPEVGLVSSLPESRGPRGH